MEIMPTTPLPPPEPIPVPRDRIAKQVLPPEAPPEPAPTESDVATRIDVTA